MNDYRHGELYIYDAASSTFDAVATDMAALQQAFTKCIAEDYGCFVAFSSYRKTVSVHLNKHATADNPMSLEVKAEAPTVSGAFELAFKNFPKNPLDGSKWATNRLAPPSGPVEDGEFKETE